MKKAMRIEIIKKSIDDKIGSHFTINPDIFSISLLREDLTIQDTNVIVNAANNQLLLGSGVAGAIRNKGGNEIQQECDEILLKENNDKSLNNGDVAYTKIGKFTNKNLKYIFHAVGPVYFNGKKKEKRDLTNCFLNCFRLADKLKLSSIALPPISTGIFGYPKEEGAEVFYNCVEKYFLEYFNSNKNVKVKDIKEEPKNSNIKNLRITDSLYIDSNKIDNNIFEIKYDIDHKIYENINEPPVKNKENKNKKEKTKFYEDINGTYINEFTNFTNNTFSREDDLFSNLKISKDINQSYNSNNISDKNEKKIIKEDYTFKITNDYNPEIYNREFLKDNELQDKDNNLIKQKIKQSRILRSNNDEKIRLELENYTLNDINIAIIDRYTHEIFYDVLMMKLIEWSKYNQFEIRYTEC